MDENALTDRSVAYGILTILFAVLFLLTVASNLGWVAETVFGFLTVLSFTELSSSFKKGKTK